MFRAAEPETGHPVAVKAFHLDLTPELADELADALQQLVDVGLAHPAIVTPLAVGCEGSVPYLAQEYIAAESLDVAMRHYAPAAAERAVPLLHHLAGAVDAAHDAGVLHGSLHLRDVFVSPDEARATGFGVARALEDVGLRAPVRRPYAAPEVVGVSDWGAEADRYAVAAIAYELLTGRRATGSGDEIIERLGSVYVGDEGALPALSEVFAWGLSEDPGDRPGRAAELVAALAEALGVEVIEPEPVDPPAAPTDDGEAAYDDALLVAGEGSDPDGAGSTPSAVHVDAPSEGTGTVLPASLRERTTESPVPDREDEERAEETDRATAVGADDDLDPLDALEPIEDEEPISLGGRVRAILQGTAAVILGVLGAGVVYFLFGAEVGGGGDAPAPDDAVPLGEVTESRPVFSDPPVRTADADPLPPTEPILESTGERPPAANSSSPLLRDAEPEIAGPRPVVPAESAAEPEPPAAASPVGWLLVRTFPPGATVSVEGVDRGQTPLSLRDVPYGTHRIEIQAPGYESQTREVSLSAAATVAAVGVELAPGGEAPASVAPASVPSAPSTPTVPAAAVADAADVADGTVGSVLVESRPAGARVVIDGEPAGVTPFVVTDLRPGRREVRIEHDGYMPWVTVVEVPAFDRIRVAASLDRARP